MKYLTLERCKECPYYIIEKRFCKKLRLSGDMKKLFKHCPLPEVKKNNSTTATVTIEKTRKCKCENCCNYNPYGRVINTTFGKKVIH